MIYAQGIAVEILLPRFTRVAREKDSNNQYLVTLSSKNHDMFYQVGPDNLLVMDNMAIIDMALL